MTSWKICGFSAQLFLSVVLEFQGKTLRHSFTIGQILFRLISIPFTLGSVWLGYIYLCLTDTWAASLSYLWKPSYHRLVSSFSLSLPLSFAFLKFIGFSSIWLRFSSGFAQLFASLFMSLLNWIRVISCARISNIGAGCSVCWPLANYMTKKSNLCAEIVFFLSFH